MISIWHALSPTKLGRAAFKTLNVIFDQMLGNQVLQGQPFAVQHQLWQLVGEQQASLHACSAGLDPNY